MRTVFSEAGSPAFMRLRGTEAEERGIRWRQNVEEGAGEGGASRSQNEHNQEEENERKGEVGGGELGYCGGEGGPPSGPGTSLVSLQFPPPAVPAPRSSPTASPPEQGSIRPSCQHKPSSAALSQSLLSTPSVLAQHSGVERKPPSTKLTVTPNQASISS